MACGDLAWHDRRSWWCARLGFLLVRRLLSLTGLGPAPDAKDVEIAALAEVLVRLQAACWYSWMSPPSTSMRSMRLRLFYIVGRLTATARVISLHLAGHTA